MAQRARPATALAVAARFLNVEDWAPLPGMIKRQCPRCRYLFVDSEELRCPGLRRPGETAAPHASGNSTPLGPVVRRGAHDVGHRPGQMDLRRRSRPRSRAGGRHRASDGEHTPVMALGLAGV